MWILAVALLAWLAFSPALAVAVGRCIAKGEELEPRHTAQRAARARAGAGQVHAAG